MKTLKDEPGFAQRDEFASSPEIEVEDVPDCPVCGCKGHSLFTRGYDYELRTCRNSWSFVECDDCRHVWLNPRPAVNSLGTIYPSSYYAYNYAAKVHPIARWAKEKIDTAKMRSILRRLDAVPRSFVDVGCGDGRYLRLMRRKGLRVEDIYGLELNERIVRRLEDEGFSVFCQRVEDCHAIAENSVDVITMFHVIEHVDDPSLIVSKLRSWLRPGGVLAIETPNIVSLDARWFRDSYWGGYHFPRHWNLFSRSTLSRLLADHGFEVRSTTWQTGHSFWMYSLHHRLRYGASPRPRLAALFDPFSNLPMLAAFTAWDKCRGFVGCHTSAMLITATKRD